MIQTALSTPSVDTASTTLAGSNAPRLWERTGVCALLLLLFGICARLPALQGTMLWDDEFLVRDNPFIKSPLLIFEAFRQHLFPGAGASHYRPLQTVSYCLDYLLWNRNAYGFHLSNIFWHVGSGILLYLLCCRLLPQMIARVQGAGDVSAAGRSSSVAAGAALAVAMLWIVHPVHSAAVDYISGRADSLAFFFACGGWLLYLRARSVRSPLATAALLTLAAISGLLALCSRESGAIWLLVFVVHLFAIDNVATRRAKVIATVICLAICTVYLGLRQLPENSAGATAPRESAPATRAVLMVRALGDYGQLMFFPSNLHMERTVAKPALPNGYGTWGDAVRREYLSWLGLMLAAGLLYGALRKGPAQGLRAFGAFWFIAAYLPISNLFPLNATVAEHWLYLPSVGFLLFIVGCCLELPARGRSILAATACLAVIALTARSYSRSGDWMSSETLYRHTIGSGGSKIRVALNLGQSLVEKGDYAKAEPLLRKIFEVNPEYPPARNALAQLLSLQGNKKEAEEILTVRSKGEEPGNGDIPRNWVAAMNRARLRYNNQDPAGAIAILEQARANHAGTWQLVNFESEILRETKGPDAALPLVSEFVRQTWWHADASIALGRLYLAKDDLARADAAFRHASRLDVHDAESVSLMSLVKLKENRLDEAYKLQCRAVARQPDEPRQYLILSDVLSKMGRHDEAQGMLVQVAQMQALAKAASTAN